MPLDVVADERRRWIVVRATGSVTLPEILALIPTVRARIDHRMWPLLFDARSATTAATEEDVHAAVAVLQRVDREQGPRGHAALVADDDVLYARMLLYEGRSAQIGIRTVRVFRALEDAERWLAIVSAARHFG